MYCDGTNFSYITQASLTHYSPPDIVITKNTHFIKNFSSPLYADSSLFNHGVPQFHILHNILFGIPKNMPSHLRQSFFMKIGSTIFTPTWFIINLGSAHNKLFTVNLSKMFMFGLRENLFSYYWRLRSYSKQTT